MILTANIVPPFFSGITVCCLYRAADWTSTVEEFLAFKGGLLSVVF